jgi:hypothetical protein
MMSVEERVQVHLSGQSRRIVYGMAAEDKTLWNGDFRYLRIGDAVFLLDTRLSLFLYSRLSGSKVPSLIAPPQSDEPVFSSLCFQHGGVPRTGRPMAHFEQTT